MTKRVFLAVLLLAALVVEAHAARRPRPKNPRRAKQRPAQSPARSTATVEEVLVSTVPAMVVRTMPAGRWDPKVRAEIQDIVTRRGRRSADYDAEKPPVALLPMADALAVGDAGELVFRSLVEHADFKFSDEFWRLVPVAYGRQKLMAAHGLFADLPTSTWERQPAYKQYRKGFHAAYANMCARAGRAECRAFLARLARGFTEDELATYTQGALREESIAAAPFEDLTDAPDDKAPLRIRRGWSYVPEMRELLRLLRAEGWDVWVVDTDLQKVLEAALRPLAVDPSRVEGYRLAVKDEKLTGELVGSAPIRGGKVEVVATLIGRAPQLVIGTRAEDEPVLSFGSGLRVLLDAGDAELRGRARERGWLVQPSFAR